MTCQVPFAYPSVVCESVQRLSEGLIGPEPGVQCEPDVVVCQITKKIKG